MHPKKKYYVGLFTYLRYCKLNELYKTREEKDKCNPGLITQYRTGLPSVSVDLENCQHFVAGGDLMLEAVRD